MSWYEPAKGYGFVTPEDGSAEIFVHSSAIVGGGVISEGQRVAFLVVAGEKGPQADHLLPLGPDVARRDSPADGADGTVSWYDGTKGFGFIAPDSGGDGVFVHVSALGPGLAEIVEGDRVRYDVVVGDKGPNARHVELVRGPRSARTVADRGGSTRPSVSGGSARPGEGTVARYDEERGFGFITPDAGARTCSSTFRSCEAPRCWRRATVSGSRSVRATGDRRLTASSWCEAGEGATSEAERSGTNPVMPELSLVDSS